MNLSQARSTLSGQAVFSLLLMLLLGSLPAGAGTKRILVVGDSWATFMTHPIAGEIFQTTLKKQGYDDVELVATDKTAVPGSRADQWASNHKGKLDDLRQALEANPTIDIVFVVIGGNDFLREALKTNLSALTAEGRSQLWTGIRTNIQKLVDTILAVRPRLNVVLCDYDYLNIAATARSPLKHTFNGISQVDFNHYLLDLGREKQGIAEKTKRCSYIGNWGLMQYHFGDPDEGYAAGTVKLPGGDASKPGPAKAFDQGALNDGIHLNPEGYRVLLENVLKQGLGAMLKTNASATGT